MGDSGLMCCDCGQQRQSNQQQYCKSLLSKRQFASRMLPLATESDGSKADTNALKLLDQQTAAPYSLRARTTSIAQESHNPLDLASLTAIAP